MKRILAAILIGITWGCAVDAPKRSVVLPPGTKIISDTPGDIRSAFGLEEGRSGKVVELDRPLVLSEP